MKALFISALLLASFVATAQDEKQIDTTRYVAKTIAFYNLDHNMMQIKPLVILDGIRQDFGFDLKNVNPSKIKSISVLKSVTAIPVYGDAGKNGVLIITSKDGVITNDENLKEPSAVAEVPKQNINLFQVNPLLIVDGLKKDYDFLNNGIKSNDIESIQVIKDANALLLYGDSAKKRCTHSNN